MSIESAQFPFDDLYRFSTTAFEWEKLDAALVSGSPPSARHNYAMAAVGSNLFLFGGTISCGSFCSEPSADLLVYVTSRVIAWPASGFSTAWLTRVYDDDILQVTGDANWPSGTVLIDCLTVSVLPCSLTIAGDPSAASTIQRHTESMIVCEAASGCTGVTMRHVTVACTSEASAAGPLQISGAGAVATIEGATFSGCAAESGFLVCPAST